MPHKKRKKTFKSLEKDPVQKMWHNFDTIEKGLEKKRKLREKIQKQIRRKRRERKA